MEIIGQCREELDVGKILEMRLDGAFFHRDVLEILDSSDVEYAIKVPFLPWLNLKELIVNRTRWHRVDDEVEHFLTQVQITPWSRKESITLYRWLLDHKHVKHFQLDLFDPDDGHYKYSAVASNKNLKGPALW